MKENSLGTLRNSLEYPGWWPGAQVLGMLGMAGNSGNLDMANTLSSIAVGSGIVMAVIGLIRKAMAK